MSSALAAFAQAQQAEAAPPEVDDDVQTAVVKPQAANSASSLAAFAQARQESSAKTTTLMDVVREQNTAMPSLLEVARNEDARRTNLQLTAIAAEVKAEEQEAAERRTQQIEREIAETSKEVKHEMQIKRHSQVADALREAAREEQACNQAEEEFEPDDPVVEKAAARIVEATSTDPKEKKTRPSTLSVDRHLLKQRQQRRGLEAQSKSTAKAKTMKEKLSSFQFHQLSLTQQRVFLAMLVEDQSAGANKKKCNMHAIEQLAKDRASQARQKQKLHKIQPPKYAKLDDRRHCRFKPKIKNVDSSRARNDDDDDDDGGDNQRREDFIRRMEATERVRTEQLRRTRAEREYNARVDKKECPQCGNPQSYAELTQKRKKCPNCGVTYKSRLAWSEIADEFLERMAAHLKTRLAPNNQQEHESQVQKQGPIKLWRDVRDEFLGRVQLDLMQREMSKELILQELEAQCTFSPQISERAKRLRLGDFDERLRRDLENRRVRQEQYRVLSNAIARAEASQITNRKPVGRLQRSFEERLKKDLAQRRERLAANENPKLKHHPSGSSGRSRGLY